MTEADFKSAVAKALGPLAKAPENPNGGEGVYVDGEHEPYVVLVEESYKFSTPEAAIAKARQLHAMV